MGDGFFNAWFAICAVLGVALVALIIWAVVQLVTWLTSSGVI